MSEIVRLGHPRTTDGEHDPKLEKPASGLGNHSQLGNLERGFSLGCNYLIAKRLQQLFQFPKGQVQHLAGNVHDARPRVKSYF